MGCKPFTRLEDGWLVPDDSARTRIDAREEAMVALMVENYSNEEK